MERFKKSVDNMMPFILIASVLLMNILLVAGMMKMFFGWDTTILAGAIAFIGAILGGAITLIGVNKTIKENRRKDELEIIKENFENVSELKRGLFKILIMFNDERGTRDEKIRNLLEIQNDLTLLSESFDVFVLEGEIKENLAALTRLVDGYRTEVLLRLESSVQVDLPEIRYRIAICIDSAYRRMHELREEYNKLLAP